MITNNLFLVDPLSILISICICFFTVILFIFSLGFIKTQRFTYYTWFFATAVASLGVVLSNHLIAILVFWGFLGLAIFKLINVCPDAEAARAAKKTLIIIGGTDAFLLLGFLLYMKLAASTFITGTSLAIHDSQTLLAFLCIAAGAFAKAGCMPFHTWIPDTAASAPVPVVAYLPASLDKLLGIYLLIRIAKDTFILNATAQGILFLVGSMTILCAVMMALVQHNIKRLLGYHAVSQVGYMILGIGCASPLGFAAALFHMINHAIYKSCLFLAAGNVEKQTGATEMDKLGGLAKYMPITFIVTLIASFSISGIPPFNGFVSKWMVYQGLIEFAQRITSLKLQILAIGGLVIALAGSSLTLASFLKLNYGVFLGSPRAKTKEARTMLLIAPVILAGLCVIFGIFSRYLIMPVLVSSVGYFILPGLWNPLLITTLIVAGILIGFILFTFTGKKLRQSPSFIGGEPLAPAEEVRIEDFYNTIRELRILKRIYRLAEEKFFDIYDQSSNFVFGIGRFFQYLHNGVLPTYLVWTLLGMIGLFFVLVL
ncbi:MAG: hypothetical protein KKF80_01330, partial [Candidatus Omnitrophica bacterium]|nr:hypothetical protein [Candidatus Omnitrophota bacterium]